MVRRVRAAGNVVDEERVDRIDLVQHLHVADGVVRDGRLFKLDTFINSSLFCLDGNWLNEKPSFDPYCTVARGNGGSDVERKISRHLTLVIHTSSLSHQVVYLLIVIGTPIPETSVTVI